MPKLSIICPVYNTSKYIDRFLWSIINQTFKDFEIVFVYDKSSDDSLDKLIAFNKTYNGVFPISIIKNENKNGAGFAKDLGYKNCDKSSTYVIFLDSDDYFENDYFEKLIHKAESSNSDITCIGYYRVNENTGSLLCTEMVHNPDLCNIDQPSFPLFLINTAVWNKVFKRELVEKCSFGLVSHAEDFYFLLHTIINAQSISFINEPKYTYLIHSGSLINTMSLEKYYDTLESFLEFKKYNENKRQFDLVSGFMFLRIGLGTTLRVCQSEPKEKKHIICSTKKYLKQNFNIFGKNKMLSLHFLLKAGKKGFAIWLLKVLYKINLFGIAANYYISKSKKDKKENRW